MTKKPTFPAPRNWDAVIEYALAKPLDDCGCYTSQTPKTCPYEAEINGTEKTCTCCEACRQDCADNA